MSEQVTEKQIAYGVVFGVVFGIVFGILTRSIYLGVATGFALGVVLTSYLAGQARQRHMEERRNQENETEANQAPDAENQQPQE